MFEPILKVSNISKQLRSKNDAKVILSTTTFTLTQNERLGIFGPTGSGKTTLARILKGYISQTSGTIYFLGNVISSKDLLKNPDIQLVFQNPYESLSPKLSIKELLLEPLLYYYKDSLKNLKRKVEYFCFEFNIEPALLEKYSYQLSGGERQRIALLRALLVQPKVLICDEILSSLDQLLQFQVLDLLLKYQQMHKASIIFISHDLSLIQKFCNRVLLLQNGVGILYDSTENLLLNENLFIKNSIDALNWLESK